MLRSSSAADYPGQRVVGSPSAPPFHSNTNGALPPPPHASPPSDAPFAGSPAWPMPSRNAAAPLPLSSVSSSGAAHPALTPEREEALRARGLQLLEEHRRESAAGGGAAVYTPAERATLQQHGMELLRAAREEAAANGGQHVPAPLLAAAARVAAATSAVVRRRGDSAGGSSDDDGLHKVHASQQQQQQQPVHSPPSQQHGTTDQAMAASADLAALTAEVDRLQRVVAAQQAELLAAQAVPPAASETFTRAQMDAARQDLIQQFNEHMSQCERTNQDYWAQVSAEHQQEMTSLKTECDALREEVETLRSAQVAENESSAEAAASLQQAVTVLRQELEVAQRESAAACRAREAAEQQVSLLTAQIQEHSEEATQLRAQLAAAVSEAHAAQLEAERVAQVAQADSAELDVERESRRAIEASFYELQAANAELRAFNEQLQAANAELQATKSAAAPAAAEHGAANPFADADAEDPFGGSSTAAPAPAAVVDDAELRAARERIAELEAANAELEAAKEQLHAANAELQATKAAAAPAAAEHGAANPFADADAEDPFGGSSTAAPAPAAVVDDAELRAARERIAELEAANAELEAADAELRAFNEQLRAANAELQATKAAPAAVEHGAANPFADADAEDPFGGSSTAAPAPAAVADDAELRAARERIAELEAANAELEAADAELRAVNAELQATKAAAAPVAEHGAANPFADADAEDPFGGSSTAAPAPAAVADDAELRAAREHIADLEDALAEAAGEMERLQEEVEDKAHLIQALRAGEAALGSLPAEALSSGSGWGTEGSGMPPADSVPALRARIAELSRDLEEERAALRRTQEEQQAQQQSSPRSPSSQLVPGMEELGRQYADVQHRLSLAEDARAALEEEVRRLRSTDRATVTDVPASTSAAAAATNPFAEADDTDDSEDVDGAVVTVRAGRTTQGGIPRLISQHRHVSDDEEGHNTPETQASFHMGRDSLVAHGSSAFGEGEDVLCHGPDDGFSSPSREEEQSETMTTSAAARGEERARRVPRESGETLDDDEDEAAEDADVSVSTRVTAARGRLPPPPVASKVEDSGVAMQELGRQYAEAQHRLLRSEEARQSLEGELAELRQQLEQLQGHSISSGQPHDSWPRHPREDPQHRSGSELDEAYDDEDETRTITTSFASSVPTAVRGRRAEPVDVLTAASDKDPRLATAQRRSSRGPSDPAARSRHDEDGATLGLIPTAAFSERGDDDMDEEVKEERGATVAAVEEQAAGINAALYHRIAELEEELRTLSASHEEELQALADAAADRIAALEQEYAAATQEDNSAPQGTAAPQESLDDVVAAARVKWEQELEEEREDRTQQLHACQRDMAALQAEAEASTAALAACQAAARAHEEACTTLQAELAAAEQQQAQLNETLEAMRTAHEAELAAVAEECSREMEEHDELLRQRLEEQEALYEAAIQQLDQQQHDQLRLLAESAEDAAADGGEGHADEASINATAHAKEAAHWREQHDTLQERFDQLQREYDAFTQDTAALQRRLRDQEAVQQEQEQQRTTRDVAAQQLTGLHQRLEEMTRLLEAAQADAHARAEEVREAAAQHGQAEQALRDELAAVRAQARSARDEVARLTDLNNELSELLQHGATGVESALRERDSQLAALETQVRDLKLQAAAAGDRLTERQAQLQEQRDICDDLQRQVAELTTARRTLESEVWEEKRAAEELKRSAAHASDRAAREAEQGRVAAQHALAEQHVAHQAEVAALQAQLDDLRGEVEVAQTVAATVPLEAQKHQRDLETVRERLTEALRVQQELQQQLRGSRAEVERQRRLLRGVNADGSEINTSAITADDDAAPTGATDARVNVLLRSLEELEERLQEATAERDAFQQERDRVAMQLKSAARVAEVKEQAMRRQEAELRGMRGQLATLRDDLAQRVQSNHALQLEMDHLQERAEDVAVASAELQAQHAADVARRTLQEHAEALLFAKAMTIPRALEDHVSVLCSAYHAMLQVSSKDREYVYGRCDTIEKAAGEAMAEAEAQNRAYETALADAQEEQQQLRAIIEDLEDVLHKAEETKTTAVAEAKAAKEELETVQRQAREDVFAAQRDLQVAELQHADTLHSLSLLQDEVTNTAALIKNQKATYERREAELAEEVGLLQAELETRKAAARALQQSTEEQRNGLQDLADEAEQQRDAAVREAQALRAQLERALPRLTQLEDDEAQRTADLMDTAQQLSALHKKTSSTEEVSKRHIEELNQTLQELLRAHALLQRTHTTTEATADRLKAQLDTVSQELERTAAKAHAQEEEAALLRGRLQEVEARTNRVITDDQARLRDADRRIQGLEQRNTALQQECKSVQEAHQSLRMEFESTADALQRRTEAAATTEQQQAHQIRLLRERADTLEEERLALLTAEQAITKERDAGQREIVGLRHRIEHLQHHLSDANAHNDTLNHEMVELKTEHAGEVDRLRESITEAQKELVKCRQLLVEAETHQVEQDSTHYSLTTEVNVLREELRAARAQAEKAQQQYQKEKTEREEMATLLQSQMAQLYEELRGKQEQLRGLENTTANQTDTIHALRQDVAEAEERLKHTRKELLDVQEAATAAKEHHRRDRYDLQSRLNTAEDALAETTRQQEQYRQRMTAKAELYEVAELALRGEVTDLRADVARLEEALTASTHGRDAAEDVTSRQAHSIKAAETELQTLRAQTARDMAELTALKVQLQQRTSEVERCRRDGAAQLASEKLQGAAERAAACDALEEALRKEQQATKDAREARERALASLDRKQKDVAVMEEECRAMRTQLRQLQRRVDAAEYQLTALEGLARDSADDLGVSLEELREGDTLAEEERSGLIAPAGQRGDGSGIATGAPKSAVAVAAASVQAVLDELLRRLNVYTFAANTLDTEDSQLAALTQALEQHQDVVDALVEASTAGDRAASTVRGNGVTPVRGQSGSALGLNSTPAARGASRVSAASPAPAAAALSAGQPRPLTAAQQIFVQQVSQASSTYVHRVEDHVRTAQQMLRAVVMAVGAHEVATTPSRSRAAGGAAINMATTAALPTRPTTVALSTRHKLQVAATVSELHRRTATLTRAVERVTEGIVGGFAAANVQAALQDLRRVFAESERYALLPFNELLCVGESGSNAAGAPPGGSAGAADASYSARSRQEDGLHTPMQAPPPPPPQQQQQRPHASALPMPPSLSSAAAAGSHPARHSGSGVGGGAPQLRGGVDESAVVSTLSPIPPDEEGTWF